MEDLRLESGKRPAEDWDVDNVTGQERNLEPDGYIRLGIRRRLKAREGQRARVVHTEPER